MPFAPKANPDLAGIMMAAGISKLGEGLGQAAKVGAGASKTGANKAAYTAGIGTQMGGAGNDELVKMLRSYGISDQQIMELLQQQGGGGQNSSYGMDATQFGL